MNILAIHNVRPSVMGLLDMRQAFLDFREEVVTRRSIFELRKARDRVHILEGLLKALQHIDEIVALIKASANVNEARTSLMERFAFTEVQAQAILDMRLQRLTGLEREKIADEHKTLMKEIHRLELILSDRKELLKVIRSELLQISEAYSDERRTVILKGTIGDFNVEDLIPDEKMVVTITKKGYMKRTEIDKYRTQKRGGVGVKGAAMGEEDFIFSRRKQMDAAQQAMFDKGLATRKEVMGEDFVAFRDSAGRVGLLDSHCPHRLADLYFGRNEEGGWEDYC